MTYCDIDRALRLAQEIQTSLTDDLRRRPWKGSSHPHAGHCYVASEALYHAMGGVKSGLKPMFIRHEGSPHWFLMTKMADDMIVFDLTSKQFRTKVPWSLARGKGFLTKKPSKRASILLRRIRYK